MSNIDDKNTEIFNSRWNRTALTSGFSLFILVLVLILMPFGFNNDYSSENNVSFWIYNNWYLFIGAIIIVIIPLYLFSISKKYLTEIPYSYMRGEREIVIVFQNCITKRRCKIGLNAADIIEVINIKEGWIKLVLTDNRKIPLHSVSAEFSNGLIKSLKSYNNH